MRKILLILLVSFIFLIPIVSATEPNYKTIGYLTEWSLTAPYNYDLNQLDGYDLTHLNYAFAVVKDGQIAFKEPRLSLGEDGILAQVQQWRQKYPDLKLLISVGGSLDSANFIEMVATEKSRQLFAQSIRDFLGEYNFDGVDLDWEYPACYSNNSDEESVDFTALIRTLRRELGEKYLLSVALSPEYVCQETLELNNLSKLVDWFNVMAYDLQGTGDKRLLAPLFSATQLSVAQIIKNLIDLGVPSRKMVVGVPFYARVLNTESEILSYKEIVTNLLPNRQYSLERDENGKITYLTNNETQEQIVIDDVTSLNDKLAYIKAIEAGGVFFWELSMDNGDLIKTAQFTLNKPEQLTSFQVQQVEPQEKVLGATIEAEPDPDLYQKQMLVMMIVLVGLMGFLTVVSRVIIFLTK